MVLGSGGHHPGEHRDNSWCHSFGSSPQSCDSNIRVPYSLQKWIQDDTVSNPGVWQLLGDIDSEWCSDDLDASVGESMGDGR